MVSSRARPKRVLQFLWRLSEAGGVQRVVRDLLRDIDKSRFEMHVCTVRPLWDEDHLGNLGNGIKFHSLGLTGDPGPVRRSLAAFALSRTVKSVEPDVVHVHSGTAWYLLPWLALRGRAIPVVCEIHDSPQSRRVSALNNRFETRILQNRHTTGVTHSFSVARDLGGAAPDRLEVIPIGIDLSVFSEGQGGGHAWRRRLAIPEGALVVTYVARLVASKNVDLFLDVAAAVIPSDPRTHFVVVGNGPDRERLERESVRIGLSGRVTFAGYEPRLADVLDGSDIFLSTSDYEGFGIAILEAMAAGTAVVATDVGATSELVVPGTTGMLAPRGDVTGLVRALTAMLNDSEMRGRMAAAGRGNALRLFDVSTMVGRYEALYERVASRSG